MDHMFPFFFCAPFLHQLTLDIYPSHSEEGMFATRGNASGPHLALCKKVANPIRRASTSLRLRLSQSSNRRGETDQVSSSDFVRLLQFFHSNVFSSLTPFGFMQEGGTPPFKRASTLHSLQTEEERLLLSLSERVIRLSFLFRFCATVRFLQFFHGSVFFLPYFGQ